MARQIAADPANLPLKLDFRMLRVDRFRRFGSQNGPFSPRVDDQGYRMSICGKSYKGSSVQGCDQNLPEQSCAAAGCLGYRESIEGLRRSHSSATAGRRQ